MTGPQTATGRKVVRIYGSMLLDDVSGIEQEAGERIRKAAQKVIDGYEARGLVHDVDCEALTEDVYALQALINGATP